MGKGDIWAFTMRSDSFYEDVLGEEKWFPKANSINMNYFGIGFGLYYMFVHFKVAEWIAWLVVAVFVEGFYQIINAMIPAYGDDKVNYIGGYGWSYIQWIFGAGGATIGLLVDLLWPPHIRETGGDDDDEDDDDYDDDDM